MSAPSTPVSEEDLLAAVSALPTAPVITPPGVVVPVTQRPPQPPTSVPQPQRTGPMPTSIAGYVAPAVVPVTPPVTTAPLTTDAEQRYDYEKKLLTANLEQLRRLAHDKSVSGQALRDFGLAQVGLTNTDVLEGLIVLRRFSSCHVTRRQTRRFAPQAENGGVPREVNDEVTRDEHDALTLYEVWGVMEDRASLGLKASFSTDVVSAVITLGSGVDRNPFVV